MCKAFASRLVEYWRAGYALYIVTPEDRSVGKEIFAAAAQFKKLANDAGKEGPQSINVWSFPGGMERFGFDGKPLSQVDKGSLRKPEYPLQHLEDARAEGKDGIYVLQDYDLFIKAAPICTMLKRVIRQCERGASKLVIIATRKDIPSILEREITVLDYELPTEADHRVTVDTMVACSPVKINPSDDERQAAAATLCGLTKMEADNALSLSLVREKSLNLELLMDEKANAIGKDGILEYYKSTVRLEDVGGLDLLKQWLMERQLAFTPEAREFGLPQPKGVMMIGTPGCGKSYTAKAVSTLMQLPLLRFDVGKAFGSLVGESEANIRKAIATAESMSPCIMFCDEIDKAFAGTGGGGSSDSGTTQRVFGTFLTWMNDKTKPVFVVATANNVSSLPPELLRKGRWNEVFFVDLPTQEEREEIFRIHIRKRGRPVETIDLERLARQAESFSGAEIEQVVVDAMHQAFFRRTQENSDADLTLDDLEDSIRNTTPLSKMMEQQVSAMREWAKGRTRPTSTVKEKVAQTFEGRELI